ncbi:MAG: transcriptional repressor LexA [Pseudomonadales bacterium]|nr:transcriptional repressor LexA [Pseudomonadales bacterium]
MPPRSITSLTPRQREVLEWIAGFIRAHGMPPTVREIGTAFGIKSSSVFDVLKALERKGVLRRGELGARSLIVTGARRREPGPYVEVPLVGRIAAGRPIEAIQDDHGNLTVRRDLLRGQHGYALQVVGDSMIDAGILDGDYIVVCKQETAEDGDIVVALIENEATLKRFYREPDAVRLEPANPTMRSIRVSAGDFRIQGTVVAVQRLLGRR